MGTMDPYHKQPRPLTFDEKRAAEAAFTGQPPGPAWSEAGQRVYDGLVGVLSRRAANKLSRDYERLALSGASN